VAAIEGARRWVVEPVDVACVREAEMGPGDSEETARLGRADGAAVVLLRFSSALPPDSDVLEAFVLLDRATDVEADPAAISMKAERIVGPWTGTSASWVGRPKLRDVAAPWTNAFPRSGPTVRIDVRSVLADAARGESEDLAADRQLGIGIVARGSSPTGLVFALASGRHGRGPRLELYVK
jgi:hypothetical protein